LSRETLSRSPNTSRTLPRRGFIIAAAAVAVFAVLLLIFSASLRQRVENVGEPGAAASGFRFQVGSPGPGDPAPTLELPAADGTSFALSDVDGNTLLYFQEGLMCQPCFDQLADIEQSWAGFEALGIGRIVSITTDPVELLQQARVPEAFASPVLSDADRRVSDAWGTLDYGMMGGSHNGHSFIVVGEDGSILWRADYGGAPDYTMYLPVPALLADLAEGLDAG
jgi:peroxiredoxin Q/BCP